MKKQATILKILKSSLPILEAVKVEKGMSSISNLDTWYNEFTDYVGENKVTSFEDYDLSGPTDCQGGYYGMDVAEYPELEKFIPSGSVVIDQANMNDLFEAIKFVSNDDLRPVMTGILICKDIVATNAHYLISKRINSYSTSRKKHPTFIIRIEAIKILKVLKMKTCKIEYDKKMERARISGNGFEIVTRLIQGNYPNYEAVIPQSFSHKITVDRKQLISSLTAILPFSNKHTKRVAISTPEHRKLVLLAEDIDRNVEKKIEIPCNSETTTGEIGFNMPNFLVCLKAEKTDQVIMTFSKPSRGAMVGEDILLMPLMNH